MLAVKNFMKEKLYKVSASDTVLSAFKLMREKEIRHLPVFDEDEKIVGMLSDRDILKAIELEEKGMPCAKVYDFMSWPVEIVSEDMTIPQVIDKIVENKISALLVKNDLGIPIGIITTEDLILGFQALIQKEEALIGKVSKKLQDTGTL